MHSTRALAALALTAFAQAQQPVRTLHGTLHDRSGNPLPNTRMELLQNDTVLATTTTASDGSYTLPLSGNGSYSVRIDSRIITPVLFQTTTTQRDDITLDTPFLAEQITVTATGFPTPLAQSGAPITILPADEYPYSPEIQQPLRLVPGVQITQAGQTGAASSLFLRGAESNATKVLLDGVPLNDVGGLTNFANIASTGIAQMEVLRQPNSALYGSDALAGVVSLTSARGSTPLPLFAYAIDGGNFGFFRQELSLAGAHKRFDYFNTFARLNTANSIAQNAFHNATFLGNYGFAPDSKTALRLSLRRATTNGGQPNAFTLYGVPDQASQKQQDFSLSATAEHQTTARWHNLFRYGRESLATQYNRYAPGGTAYYSDGYLNGYIGKQVTLTGANGYKVSGQAIIDFSPTSASRGTANRDFIYVQSDYRLNPHTVVLGAFKYEAERGTAFFEPTLNTVDRRNQSYTLQLSGDARNRLFYVLGSGIEKNDIFGTALTPRVSLAYYLARPSAQRFLTGTKLHASFGKGIKESSVYQQNGSLYGVLSAQPNGPALIAKYNTRPLGAEYSRNYDVGVEQQFGDGRARVNATFFHNEYTNGIQYVPNDALVTLGIPAASASQFQYGAYVNSQALRSMGAELELEYRLAPRIFARAGYTYLDAVVQRSFSSDALFPSFNTDANFPTLPIGAYAPLVGARPFRRAPHSGYFAVSYARQRFSTQLSGTLVGRRDDSTFLTDKDFGNSLLLPNRNLDPAYQRLELSADYHLTHNLTTYANLQNLLNQNYSEAFGYPALPFNLRGGLRYTFGGETWRIK